MNFLLIKNLLILHYISTTKIIDESNKIRSKPPTDNSFSPVFNKFAVNTECSIAAQIGANILRKGGNAVDAAIATALSIGIVNSFSSGIGGGGFMIIKNKEEELVLDFREKAPLNVSIEYFQKNPGHAVNTIMSMCVPGEIKGFYEAHKKFGKIPWKEIFEEPINLCLQGFEASALLITKLKKNEEYILADEGLRKIYMKNNHLIKEGDRVYRIALANTLKKIADDPKTFYEGEIADKILTFIKNKGGIIEKEDFLQYEVQERPVLHGKFLDYKVTTSPFPTSGAFILLGLNILNNFDLSMIKQELNIKNQAILYHILIETFKHMFSKRGEAEDPKFMLDYHTKELELISERTAYKMFQQINSNNALDRDLLGPFKDFKNDNGTTHLNVVDSNGMCVLLTSSINLEFGSKIMDPETGILFNNHIDDFYIPGKTNYYDLNFDGLNLLEPGKRSFSSASPVILENSKEIILLGAAGGTKIPTSIVSTILYYIVFDDLEFAIKNYRIHDQLKPAKTFVEATYPERLQRNLEKLGHTIQVSSSNTTFTSVNGIIVTKNSHKKILAVSDNRKAGFSCGE